MNNNIKGIVIDPGHGGVDGGANGNNQLEKDFTLKISKYMYDRFKELGIPVEITRDIDITLSPTERVNKILSFYGNDPNILVISNHLNAGGGSGAEVIYALRNSPQLADSILKNIEMVGQKIRKTYQRTLPTDSTKDYYFIHRNTGVTEPLIIEYGFIDGTKKELDFLNNNYKELAEAVIQAILNYKGIPYTKPIAEKKETYTVKKGDNLYDLAKKYNTTVSELKTLNNLTTNNLSIGQILKLPIEKQLEQNKVYTVKAGDTLYRIATQNNTTVDIIKTLNNLKDDTLSIGQQILIPNTEFIEIPTTTTNYNVKAGDTLYSISKKYNTTVDKIKRLNNLFTDILTIGQNLKLPLTEYIETPSSTVNYIVKPGDTLYSIANSYNTTVNNIKQKNNLTSNLLLVGESLLI